jgi:hypothetical protein
MTKKPSTFKIKSGIIQAILCGDVIKIKGIVDYTGHSRNTVIKYLPEIRDEILKAWNYHFKAKKEYRL